MSILEGVPDVATELNDSLIVFFFRRVMGDKMRNEKRHSKTEKKKRHVGVHKQWETLPCFFMYQSWVKEVFFNKSGECIGICKRQLTPKNKNKW